MICVYVALLCTERIVENLNKEVKLIRQNMMLSQLFAISPYEARIADSVESPTYKHWRQDLKRNYYNCDSCLITGVKQNSKLDSNDPLFVRAAHIIPKSYMVIFEEKFKNERFDNIAWKDHWFANDCKNGMFMIKFLEDAFDKRRFCIIPDALRESHYHIYVLDETLIKQLTTFEIELPLQKTIVLKAAQLPYRRSLYCQAVSGVQKAIKKGWIDENHELYDLDNFYEPSLLDAMDKNSQDNEDDENKDDNKSIE